MIKTKRTQQQQIFDKVKKVEIKGHTFVQHQDSLYDQHEAEDKGIAPPHVMYAYWGGEKVTRQQLLLKVKH